MKNKTMLKIVFLSLILSSCGLIDQFKTPEQSADGSTTEVSSSESETPADAPEVAEGSEAAAPTAADVTDDLFSKTLEETNTAESKPHTDNPTNLASADDAELKTLEDEFSANAPSETKIKEAPIALAPANNPPPHVEAPVLVEEALPEIHTQVETPQYNEAGAVKNYHVQRGDTLMQIAFKLYGDISKWKEIKRMNSDKLTSNGSLKKDMTLKYHAPATPFVWNPNGTAYLIKNGETLGTISNTVYSTPKKWKAIWENNKPLIKNPNVIYAGFTLYYTNGGMANYVQPKTEQPKKEILARELARDAAIRENAVEEVIVDKKINAQFAPTKITTKDQQVVDEAIETLSSTKKGENEVDLINNVSMPLESNPTVAPANNEIAPDIDEEIQTLN